jgi:hypothetical protein
MVPHGHCFGTAAARLQTVMSKSRAMPTCCAARFHPGCDPEATARLGM